MEKYVYGGEEVSASTYYRRLGEEDKEAKSEDEEERKR
jgi:hypothetical protein